MKFHPDARIVIVSSIIAIAILFFFANFNPQGQFTAPSVGTQSSVTSLVTSIDPNAQVVTVITDALKTKKTPKDLLLGSYNVKNAQNLQFSYNKKITDMSKAVLRQQIILNWQNIGYKYTDDDLEKLDSSLVNVDDELAKPVALIMSAVNDAARLNKEALAKLTDADLEMLQMAQSTGKTDVLETLSAKIDTAKQLKAAAYILDANAIAKPYLIEYSANLQPNSDPLGPQPRSYLTSCGTYGDVKFADPVACTIVIGGTGFTYHDAWRRTGTIVIDLGGDDWYSGNYGLGDATNYPSSTPPGAINLGIKTVVDLSGNDYYRCYISGWYDGCQGIGYRGVAIMEDLSGNDRYHCQRWFNSWNGEPIYGTGCQGSGVAGIGVLADYAGTDLYECTGYYWLNCQGFGGGPAIGLLFDDGSQSNTFICGEGSGKACQGYGELGGIGIFYLNSPSNSIQCKEECQGMGRTGSGLGIVMDMSGGNTYTCGIECQGNGGSLSLGILYNDKGNNIYYCGHFCQGSMSLYTDWDNPPQHWRANGIGVIVDNSGTDKYVCDFECQARDGMILENAGNDRYECTHDCQGLSISSSTLVPWWYAYSLWVDQGNIYTRVCLYNCGDPNGQGSNDPSNLVPTSVPTIHDLTTCTSVGGGVNGYTYSIGAYVYIDSTKVGQCVSGGGSIEPGELLPLPITVENVPTRINPDLGNNQIVVTNCDWTITEQNLGSLSPEDYTSNCETGQVVPIPIRPVDLPFYDSFDWCTSSNCILAGTHNAESNIVYSYSDATGTPAWNAFSGENAHTAGSIRSGAIGHNRESRLSFSVTLPPLPDRAAVYFLSFNYKVVGEPKDVLQLLATKRPQISLGPLGTLENPNGVACLIAPGQVDGLDQWSTFNQVPDPTNECSHLTPGEYTFDFIYSKDAALTALPDAAFIDNLQINLIPVGP